MHLIYLDDSKGDRQCCFSAICFPAEEWQGALQHLVDMRRALRTSDGVYMHKELHATEWLTQRGRVSKKFLPLASRVRLFNYCLSSIARLPGVSIFNACAHKSQEDRLFSFLLNRIQRNMQVAGSEALIISDEGKSYDAMLRRMRHYNPIPSQYGGKPLHRPLTRIIEDIVYKDSQSSYFVQAADFCAFTLLRHEKPTPRLARFNFPESLLILEPVFVKEANSKDPLGIIRA